jgi:ribosomal protein S18 acetylase RimI-like enzyme
MERMKTQRFSEDEALRKLNLSNLFSLWESVGKANGALESHRGFKKIYHHGSSWPNRIWLTGEEDEKRARSALEDAAGYLTRKDEPILLVLTEEQAAFSGDWLEKQGLSLLFSQTGMVLDLQRAPNASGEGVLEIATVKTPDESSLWSQVASESFGYRVDPNVLRNVFDLPEVTLYLGFLPDGVAGTALLCTHHGVAGFHMAGTRPEHRRKGVARRMMHHLIAEARTRGLSLATLQASAMGEPLYSQLGFRKQFVLHNYVHSIG